MQYMFLCYHNEKDVFSWSKEHEAEVLGRLGVIEARLRQQGRLGPVARLLPTTSATTVHTGRESLVVDGPFAETKEQLLGFYVIDCADHAQAVEVAQELGVANPGGAHEFRPLLLFRA